MWNFKFIAIAVLVQTASCQQYPSGPQPQPISQQYQNPNQPINQYGSPVQYTQSMQLQPQIQNMQPQTYQTGVIGQPQQQIQQQMQAQSQLVQNIQAQPKSSQVFSYSMPPSSSYFGYPGSMGSPGQSQLSSTSQLTSGSAQNPLIIANAVPTEPTKPINLSYGHKGPGFLTLLLGSMGIHMGGREHPHPNPHSPRGPPPKFPGPKPSPNPNSGKLPFVSITSHYPGQPGPNGPHGPNGPGPNGPHGSGPNGPNGQTLQGQLQGQGQGQAASPYTVHAGNHLQAVQGLAQQQHYQVSQHTDMYGKPYTSTVVSSQTSPITTYASPITSYNGYTGPGITNPNYFGPQQQIQPNSHSPILNQHPNQQVNNIPYPDYSSGLPSTKYQEPPSPLSNYNSDYPTDPSYPGAPGTGPSSPASTVNNSEGSGIKYEQNEPEVITFTKNRQRHHKNPHISVKFQESKPEFSYAKTYEPGQEGNSKLNPLSSMQDTSASTSSEIDEANNIKPYTIIEKPVVHYIEKPVVRFVEKTVVRTVEKPVIKYVEKPVIKYVHGKEPQSHQYSPYHGPTKGVAVGKEGEAYDADDEATEIKTDVESSYSESEEASQEPNNMPIKIIHHYHPQSMESPQSLEPQKQALQQLFQGGKMNEDNDYFSSYGGAYYRKNLVTIAPKTIGVKQEREKPEQEEYNDNAFKSPLIHIPKALPAYAPGPNYQIIKTHVYGPSVSTLEGDQSHLQQSSAHSSPVGQIVASSASTSSTATTASVPLSKETSELIEKFLTKK